jgi:hypothetical protein
MIVGTPFSYKSSLAMTSKKAIHIDGDRGAQRAIRNCPVLQVKNWDEVRTEDEAGLFKDKQTVIFDTPKSLLEDFIWDWTQRQKYQADDRKVYGAIAAEIKAFISKMRLQGSDIVFVSHEKSSEKKNITVYEPDITGATKQLLLRMCDQIGFIEKREIKGPNSQNIIQTVLTFNPTPEWPFCKNVAQLADIIIPNYTTPEWKTFMDTNVIQPTKDAMAKMTDEQKEVLDLIAEWRLSIDALEGDDDVVLGKEILTTYKSLVKLEPEHIKKQVQAYFMAHMAKIGWKWVGGDVKAFVNSNAKPVVSKTETPEQPSVQQTPPVEEKKEETHPAVPPAESNPNALITPAPSTPSINADGAPAGDLFDPEKP